MRTIEFVLWNRPFSFSKNSPASKVDTRLIKCKFCLKYTCEVRVESICKTSFHSFCTSDSAKIFNQSCHSKEFIASLDSQPILVAKIGAVSLGMEVSIQTRPLLAKWEAILLNQHLHPKFRKVSSKTFKKHAF